MSPLRAPLPRQHPSWLFMALLLAAVALYLGAWFELPLYPDEAALRFESARVDIDGWLRHGLFAACPTNLKTIPWTLRPGALVLTGFDQHFGWHGLRTMPFLLLILMTGLAAHHGRRDKHALLLCGAFVGVTGGGLMLLRPEWIVLVHLLACMACFAAARRNYHPVAIAGLVLLHLLVISLSLWAHLQGILLLPLSLLSLWRLLHRHAAVAALVSVLMLLLTYHGLQIRDFQCPEQPGLEQMVERNQGSATPLTDPEHRLARYAKRAARYLYHAAYKEDFTPRYLPPVTGAARAANLPIGMVLVGNLLAVGAILAIGLRTLWRRYAPGLRTTPWREQWNALLWDPWALITGSAMVLVFYGLHDITGTFYRAFTINLLAVLLVAFATPLVTARRRLQRFLGALALLAFATCLLSAAINYTHIVPALRDGYEGPGTTLKTDWQQTTNDVATLKQRCGVTDGTPRLIGDDITYQALRSHPNLIDLIYVYTDEVILRAKYDDATPAERLAKVKALAPNGLIARCKSLDFYELPTTARAGALCCLKF